MKEEDKLYLSIGQKLIDAEQSQMFGKPCFKIYGKAFICFFQNEMVFKLSGNIHADALSLDGSQLFDPSDYQLDWVRQNKRYIKALQHLKQQNKYK